MFYIGQINRNGSPYPEVTVVNLPSSLMIVHSNAFVYSTCLLEIVFRYGIYKLPIYSIIYNIKNFPEPLLLNKGFAFYI